MQVIDEIADVISDAFDDMEVLNCDTVGLYNYIMDCNEHFIVKKYIPERLCYAAIFQVEAQKRNISLTDEQVSAGNEAIELLQKDYPKYFQGYAKWNNQ